MWIMFLAHIDTSDDVDDDDVDNEDNLLLTVVIVIVVVVIICSCGCMHILFCYFCKRKERDCQHKGTYTDSYVCYMYIHTYVHACTLPYRVCIASLHHFHSSI